MQKAFQSSAPSSSSSSSFRSLRTRQKDLQGQKQLDAKEPRRAADRSSGQQERTLKSLEKQRRLHLIGGHAHLESSKLIGYARPGKLGRSGQQIDGKNRARRSLAESSGSSRSPSVSSLESYHAHDQAHDRNSKQVAPCQHHHRQQEQQQQQHPIVPSDRTKTISTRATSSNLARGNRELQRQQQREQLGQVQNKRPNRDPFVIELESVRVPANMKVRPKSSLR